MKITIDVNGLLSVEIDGKLFSSKLNSATPYVLNLIEIENLEVQKIPDDYVGMVCTFMRQYLLPTLHSLGVKSISLTQIGLPLRAMIVDLGKDTGFMDDGGCEIMKRDPKFILNPLVSYTAKYLQLVKLEIECMQCQTVSVKKVSLPCSVVFVDDSSVKHVVEFNSVEGPKKLWYAGLIQHSVEHMDGLLLDDSVDISGQTRDDSDS